MRAVTALAMLGGSSAFVVLSRPSVPQGLRLVMNMNPGQDHVNPSDLVGVSPTWGDKREGKPFGAADRDEDIYAEGVAGATGVRKVGGVRTAEEAYQPRGISDATIIKPQYIDTDDDEPWHSTCKPRNALGKSDFEKGLSSGLPFVKAETDLGNALRSSKKAADVKSAIEKALAAGARKGSPALNDADKVLKAYDKDEEAVKKAMPKPPKAGSPQGKGWDEYGPGSRNAKTHDNSVA